MIDSSRGYSLRQVVLSVMFSIWNNKSSWGNDGSVIVIVNPACARIVYLHVGQFIFSSSQSRNVAYFLLCWLQLSWSDNEKQQQWGQSDFQLLFESNYVPHQMNHMLYILDS